MDLGPSMEMVKLSTLMFIVRMIQICFLQPIHASTSLTYPNIRLKKNFERSFS